MDAVGDGTRRAILERLLERPAAVGELAAGLPVSRPAVSQHLRVLKMARLVTDTQVGTRRIYSVDPEGVREVRAYWERQWREIRPTTTVRDIGERSDGTVEAHVRLVVRDPAGNLLARSDAIHVYEFLGPHVRRMTVEQ